MDYDLFELTRNDIKEFNKKELLELAEELQIPKNLTRLKKAELSEFMLFFLERLSISRYVEDNDELYLKTTEDVLMEFEAISDNIFSDDSVLSEYTEEFIKIFDEYFSRLGINFMLADLPAKLPDGWTYQINFSPDKFSVYMGNFAKIDISKVQEMDEIPYYQPCMFPLTASLKELVSIDIPYVTIDEYCSINHIEKGTVLKQIENHFLREVYFDNNTWYLSPLAEPIEDINYSCFYWNCYLTNLPDNLNYLNQYKNIVFEKYKKGYVAEMNDLSGLHNTIKLTDEEMFKLEDFLIHHPNARVGDGVCYFPFSILNIEQKDGFYNDNFDDYEEED